MCTMKRLEQMWSQDRKYTTRYMLVFTGSFFVHAVLAVMFFLAGRSNLALFNVAAMACYVGWIFLFTRRKVNSAMLLFLYLDVVLHSCVYNWILGSREAFFLYPVLLTTVTFFMFTREQRQKNALHISTGLAVLSTLLTLLTLSWEPVAPLADAAMAEQFFQVNLLLCTVLLCVCTYEFMMETMSTQDNLSFHAENDPLTGLRNRYGFSKEVTQLHGTQYSVIMCDIDDFKHINDVYGHGVGDTILHKIGRVMLSAVEKDDIVCRWGGEEFLLVIRSDLRIACAAAERIRKKLLTTHAAAGDTTLTATMTFGVADCMEASSFDEAVRLADSRLLWGKRMGKNCVISKNSEEPVGQAQKVPPAQLDTSFLTSRIFEAFSATSDTTFIYLCNISTNVSRWSRTAVDYFGLPGEYMYDAGNVWLGFVHPDDRAAYSADVSAVLSGQKRFHDVTYRARNRDGEYVRLACKGVVTESDGDSPAMFAGTITNLGVADSVILR